MVLVYTFLVELFTNSTNFFSHKATCRKSPIGLGSTTYLPYQKPLCEAPGPQIRAEGGMVAGSITSMVAPRSSR